MVQVNQQSARHGHPKAMHGSIWAATENRSSLLFNACESHWMKVYNAMKLKCLKAAVLIAFLCLQGHALGQDYKVTITPKTEYQQTRYTLIASDNHNISLVTYQTEINQGVLRLRSESDAPLDDQIEILSLLFKTVLQKK